jgi:type I restriction enzyme S subunit
MNVPKLRFKEFTDKWQKVPLNLFTNIYGGYAFKSENLLNYKAKYQVIKMGNVNNNTLNLEKNPSYLNTISQKELPYLLEKNDIILTLTGTFGKKDFGYSYQIKNETNLLLNQRLAVFKITNSNYSANFLKYILLNNTFLNKFFRFSVGGTGNQANVSIQDIKSFKIPFPKLEEQNKIANFLTTVDKKITNLENTIISLENQKKGLLQQIFSQKLRFKDKNGNNYPNWEKKKIGLICSISTGKSNTQDKIDNGKYPFYVRSATIERSSKYLYDEEATLTVGDGVGTGKVFHYVNGKYDLHQRCYRMFNFKNTHAKYFYYFFSSHFYNRVKRMSAKNSVDSVRMNMISDMIINLPCLEEQTKIADFLSAFDRKLDNQKAQLEHWKQIKKGLLQQMFV